MFNEKDKDTVNSWMKELREARKEIAETSFQDVADYCVARREETIKLMLEISTFLENNLDVFYDANWKWSRSNFCTDALRNQNNPVLVHIPRSCGNPSKSSPLYIWIPDGIKFLFLRDKKRVVWVTHEHNNQNQYRTSYDMEKWKYNFFSLWQEGSLPEEGYEKYLKTPAYENYFGKRPYTPRGYFNIKKKVDEDWKNANICQMCIKDAISTIHDCDTKFLSEIESVKCDIRIARRDEDF